MGLYARTMSVTNVSEAFPTAQSVRELLADHGFIPLARIGVNEHWVRGRRRVILSWEGDIPGAVPPRELLYATIVEVGNDYTLSLD